MSDQDDGIVVAVEDEAPCHPPAPEDIDTTMCHECKANFLPPAIGIREHHCSYCRLSLCGACNAKRFTAKGHYLIMCMGTCQEMRCDACWLFEDRQKIPDPFCTTCVPKSVDSFCSHCRQDVEQHHVKFTDGFECVSCKCGVQVCHKCLKGKDAYKDFDNSDLLCKECLEKDYVKCDKCREVIHVEEIGDTSGFCEECETSRWLCDECNDKAKDHVSKYKSGSGSAPIYGCDDCQQQRCLDCWGGTMYKADYLKLFEEDSDPDEDEFEGYCVEKDMCAHCARANDAFAGVVERKKRRGKRDSKNQAKRKMKKVEEDESAEESSPAEIQDEESSEEKKKNKKKKQKASSSSKKKKVATVEEEEDE